jgi:predicted metal-binding protein
MSLVRVTVCQSCPAGRAGLARRLHAAVDEAGLTAEVGTVDCMSGCGRPSTVAFRAEGKTAYLFGDLSDDDLPDLLTFLRLYQAAPEGNFADARPLGGLREKAIARIPAEPVAFVRRNGANPT